MAQSTGTASYLDLGVVRDGSLTIGSRNDDFPNSKVVLLHAMRASIPAIFPMVSQRSVVSMIGTFGRTH